MTKKNVQKSVRNLSPLSLLVLAACGGEEGFDAGPSILQPGSANGFVNKGPLKNALVYADYDDPILPNSDAVRTDADGAYTLTTLNNDYTIVAVTDESTIDTSSGTVLSGVTLKAPSGAIIVTPTSTLMEEGGLTASQVMEVLGLPEGVDPLTFNAFGADVSEADALAIEKANQQIMSVVNAFAAAAEGAGASQSDAFEAALSSIAEVVKTKAAKLTDETASDADKTLDLSNATDLRLIQAEITTAVTAVDGVDAAAFGRVANDTATAVQNVNTKIEAVTDLSSDASKNSFSTTQVLAEQVKTATEAEVATAGSGSIDFKDSSKVDEAASNAAPKAISLSSNTISEAASSLVVGTLSTVDDDQPDGAAFVYTIAEISGTDFAAFEIDQVTGELSFKEQPDHETKDSYSVTILSTDAGGKTFSESFAVKVTDENEAPTVANAIADQTLAEDSALSIQFDSDVFADVDAGDSLYYTAKLSGGSLPSWLSFDAATRIFSGTPLNSDVGVIEVIIDAYDSFGNSVSDTFELTVTNTNDAPTVINPIEDGTATEGVSYVWQFDANVFEDVDVGDSLTYTATLEDGSDLPDWLTFDADNLMVSGTPPNSAVGVIVGKLIATDTSGASVADIVALTVTNTNEAPTIANPIERQTIAEDSAFSFQFASNVFADVDAGDSLTYTSDGSALPSWLSFDAGTRTFSGTPLNANVGDITLLVTATDSGSLAVTDAFGLTVTNTNDAPTVINPIEDGTATAGVSYVWQFDANVFEDVDVGDSLTYTATLEDGSDLPDWLTFDADNLMVSGTPPNSAVGVIVGKLIATDTSGASVADIAALTVTNTNEAPTGSVLINGTATQGEVLTAVSTLTDADGLGTLSYQWSAGGDAISGATSSTLTLGQSQVGKAITVAVNYTDGGGTVETATSVATSSVGSVSINNNYLLYGDEKNYFHDAGAIDADDYVGDVLSDGLGRVGRFQNANGDLTPDKAAFGSLADTDTYQLVDLTNGTTLTANTYDVTVSNDVWDFANENYVGNVANFRIIDSTGTTKASQGFHSDFGGNDTLTFTAVDGLSYYVQVTGIGYDDAQYEISFDIA